MEPVWRECLGWLDQWRVIPPGHQALSPGAGPRELVLLLRDGVVLCQLVHCLDPQSVDMTQVIYSSPEAEAVSDFVCRNNIFLFLYAAVNNFGMDPDDFFFDPADLYQYKDISKVLRTLSALSHSEKFLVSPIKGFPKKEKKLEKKIQNEEQIYDDLRNYYNTVVSNNESIYSPARSPLTRPPDTPGSPSKGQEDHNQTVDSAYEDIYQTICSPRKSRMSLDITFSKKNKRDFPIKEFVETEDKYLANLIMVRNYFWNPLQEVLPISLQRLIFLMLPEMIALHSDILLELKKKNKNIGNIILNVYPRFNIYKEYCTNLNKAQAMLETEENKNPKLKKELNKCQINAKSPFPLGAHIVLPFQRLLKYHIMLAEILKHTPETHEEFLDIELAHSQMKKFNSEVNEAKREQEENDKQIIQDEKDLSILENAERNIKSMLLANGARLQDFGRLRRAGDLKVLNASGEQTDYVFLLDTMMVLCNKPSIMQQRYRFKSAIKLKDYRIEDIRGNEGQTTTIRLFSRHSLSSSQPVILMTKSSIELDLWLRALLVCMDFLYPSENKSSQHDLVLVNLPGATCSACKERFLGIIGQCYQCRVCGATLHKRCLAEFKCRETLSESPMRRTGSIALPVFFDRSSVGSTLSLNRVGGGPRVMGQVRQLNQEWEKQLEQIPLKDQNWFAGNIDIKTATERIRNLSVGTFLVRIRGTGLSDDFALDLKTVNGVKHMKIYVENDENLQCQFFSFSNARRFPSLNQLIGYYRTNDLLENFGYKDMEGMKLVIPFKSA